VHTRLSKISVAFVEPLYEINIGYVARCMKNFGLSKLVLVKPRCRVASEAYKFAAHAQDVIANASYVDSLSELRSNFDLIVGTTGVTTKALSHVRRWITPEELSERIAQQDGEVLLVLGREDIGLTNEELALCDIVATIPANPEYPILNVSHAAAVLFYEVYKACSRSKPSARLPSREEIELLLSYFKNLILTLGESEERAERACLMLRRVIGGSPPSDVDVRMLLGVIRRAYERISDQAGG
jgi:TrmH family RNA methyltransferase